MQWALRNRMRENTNKNLDQTLVLVSKCHSRSKKTLLKHTGLLICFISTEARRIDTGKKRQKLDNQELGVLAGC